MSSSNLDKMSVWVPLVCEELDRYRPNLYQSVAALSPRCLACSVAPSAEGRACHRAGTGLNSFKVTLWFNGEAFFFFLNRIIPLSLAAAPSPSLSQTLAVCLTFSSGSTRRGCLRYKSMANEAAGPDASWLFHLPACFKGRMEKESGTTYSI